MDDPWLLVSVSLAIVLIAAGIVGGRLLRERGARLAELEPRNAWLEREVAENAQGQRRLFETGPVIVLGLEPEPPHRLRDATPNLQRARGSAASAAPVGRPLAELLHPDDAQALAACAAQALAEPGQRVQRELRLAHDAGHWRWHLLQLNAEHTGADGTTLRGYLVGIDALKQAESQAAARRQDLEALVQKMSASQRFLQTLQQFGEQLQACDSDAEAGAIVARAGPELFGRWDGALTVADAAGAMAVGARWGNFPEPRRCREADCWALRRGRLHRVSAAAPARERTPVCAHLGDGAAALPDGIAHAICVPLPGPGGRPGALHIVSRQPLDDEQLRAAGWGAEAVAETLQLALGNLRLRLALREQAMHDWLTGLHNRRHFDGALASELESSQRSGDALTLALLDIDRFKSFNDRFGHAAGDEVLKGVAAELRGFVRSTDVACRIGGEELALLLPREPPAETLRRLDGLRERIGAMTIEHAGTALPAVTVSIGVADLDHGAAGDLLRRADLALYAAKHGGRNRVACWEPALDDMPGEPAPADATDEAPPSRRARRRDAL